MIPVGTNEEVPLDIKRIKLNQREVIKQKPSNFWEKVRSDPLPNIKPLETIPKNIFAELLSQMLRVSDVFALSLVSKSLYDLTSTTLYRAWLKRCQSITIGPFQWRAIGLELASIPNLPHDIGMTLRAPCPYFVGKKVYETHKLILMPCELSIEKQCRLMRHLDSGNYVTALNRIWSRVDEELVAEELSESYWALITTAVIPDSQGKSFEEQIDLLDRGYNVSSVLEAITLLTMHLDGSGEEKEYLLTKEQLTYARCAEEIDGFQVDVGHSHFPGLSIHHFAREESFIGILAVRRLHAN